MLAATCAATAIPDVPVFPSHVAVIVVAPAATPVTSPVLSTVAMPLSADDQVIVRPVSTLPPASSGSACRCTVPPTVTGALDGETRTEATDGGTTVIDENPETPLELAAMRTAPVATPVTTPLLVTVATCEFSVSQNIFAPDTA